MRIDRDVDLGGLDGVHRPPLGETVAYLFLPDAARSPVTSLAVAEAEHVVMPADRHRGAKFFHEPRAVVVVPERVEEPAIEDRVELLPEAREHQGESLVSAVKTQGVWLRDIRDDPADLQQALGLLRVYGPDASSSEQLMEALQSRGDLLRGLLRGARAAVYADRDALPDLLNEADETLRLLNEGADMLRAFIRGNIPIEEYEALVPSLK